MNEIKKRVKTAIILDIIAMLVIGIVGAVIATKIATIIVLAFELVLAVDVMAASKFLAKLNN